MGSKQANGQGNDLEGSQDQIARLRAHIAALEEELAQYAAKYGMTEKARELFKRSVE